MSVYGLLSLFLYFVAFGFVVIAEELFPGAAENSITSMMFFVLIVMGAAFSCIQNTVRFETYFMIEEKERTV